jgi:hypothetical protein
LIIFLMGVPVRYRQLTTQVSEREGPTITGLTPAIEASAFSRLGPDEVKALNTLGLSLDFYAGYIVFFDIALVLVGAAIGCWYSGASQITGWLYGSPSSSSC